jgi:hypothetical protein
LADKGINNVSGKYLIAGLEGENFAQKILTLGSSFKSFDEVPRLIVKGKTIYEVREHIAN